MKMDYKPPVGGVKVDPVPGFKGIEGWYLIDHENRRVLIHINGAWGLDDFFSCLAVDGERASFDENMIFHGGFYRQFLSARDAFDIALYYRAYDYHFSGHSMGGAVASILAYWYHTNIKQCKLELFGCARTVGNRYFQRAFKQVFPDVVNHLVGADIIWITGLLWPWLGLPVKTKKHKTRYTDKRWWKQMLLDHMSYSFLDYEFWEDK